VKLVKACDINVLERQHRSSLAASFAQHWGEDHEGPWIPLAQLEIYAARECSFHVMSSFSNGCEDVNCVYAALVQACTRLGQNKNNSENSLLGEWKIACEELLVGSDSLLRAKAHLMRASRAQEEQTKSDLTHDIDDVTETLSFLLHRALVICRLASASARQNHVLLETEDLNMPACYEVIDMYREAELVAESAEKAGVPGMAKGADIEMQCVAASFHAKMLTAVGRASEARAKHHSILTLALSLDPSTKGFDNPSGFLRDKQWFMESKLVVEAAQRVDREAEQKERREELKDLDDEIKGLQKARNAGSNKHGDDDPRPLLKYVFEKHHPIASVDPGIKKAISDGEPIKKVTFMKVMRLYHPDKLGSSPDRRTVLLYDEIVKLLNSIYEKNWK